jgi:hypothetical protein
MTKRPKPSPTKEPQRAAPVATPVEVSQNHFDSSRSKKRKIKMEMYQIYSQFSQINTSNYSAAKLKEHEAILKQLVRELTE